MKSILTFILLAISGMSYAKDCEKGANVMGEVWSCVYDQEVAPLKKQLNLEYGLLLTEIQKTGDPRLQESLDAAQKAWLSYKDKSCQLIFDIGGGSTVNKGDEIYCQVDFYKSRIRAINKYRVQIQKS